MRIIVAILNGMITFAICLVETLQALTTDESGRVLTLINIYSKQ